MFNPVLDFLDSLRHPRTTMFLYPLWIPRIRSLDLRRPDPESWFHEPISWDWPDPPVVTWNINQAHAFIYASGIIGLFTTFKELGLPYTSYARLGLTNRTSISRLS